MHPLPGKQGGPHSNNLSASNCVFLKTFWKASLKNGFENQNFFSFDQHVKAHSSLQPTIVTDP